MLYLNYTYILLFFSLLINTVHLKIEDVSFNPTNKKLSWRVSNGCPKMFKISIFLTKSDSSVPIEETTYEQIKCREGKTDYELFALISLPPASRYEFIIEECNSTCKKGEFIYFTTNPPKPSFKNTVMENCEDNTCNIKISAIKNPSSIGSIYAIVNNKSQVESTYNMENVTQLLNLVDLKGNKWIAQELMYNKTSAKNLKMAIGGGENNNNTHYMGNIINKPLEGSFCNYDIVLIAVNYFEEAKTYSDNEIIKLPCNTADLKSIETSKSNTQHSTIYIVITVISIVLIIVVLAAIFKKRICNHFKPNRPNNNLNEETTQALVPLTTLMRTLSRTNKPQTSSLTLAGLQELLGNCRKMPARLDDEYEDVPRNKADYTEYGKECLLKNRYKNVLPYKETRIILEGKANIPDSDYINANAIDGYKQKFKYIATQGPLPTTSEDFWRMVWENDVNLIVMLTNLVENNKKKCHQYWLDHSSITFGEIKVSQEKMKEYIDYNVTEFFVYYNNNFKKVTHYQFKTWPDKTTPQAHYAFVNFIRSIRAVKTFKTPMVVHCSAGIGRTGVYIMCDYLLDRYEKDQSVDLPQALQHLRNFRPGMVQSSMQYRFIYCVVNEYLKKPPSCIEFDDFMQNFELYTTNVNLLKNIEDIDGENYWHSIIYNKATHIGWEKNMHKERSDKEPKSCKPFMSLTRHPSTDIESYYIDAIMVPNQRLTKNYIATSQPYSFTVGDFWRMVDENDTNVILSLHEIDPNNNESVVFWPTFGNVLKAVDYLGVTFVDQKVKNGYDVIMLQLTNLLNEKTPKVRNIYLLNFKTWQSDRLPRVETFLKYYDDYMEHLKIAVAKSTVLVCCDGKAGNGVFLSFSYIVEKGLCENVVDIYSCISTLRLYRDEYVTETEQLKFICRCLNQKIKALSTRV